MLQGPLSHVSNRATFDLRVQILDDETGEPMDLTGLTLTFAMSPRGQWPSQPVLQASTAIAGGQGAIYISDDEFGVAQVYFPRSAMRVCAPQDYDVGMIVQLDTDDEDVCQVFIGGIAVLDGVVP